MSPFSGERASKTTLTNGERAAVPESGSVDVDGINTRDETRWLELRQRVVWSFSTPTTRSSPPAVEDDVAFGPRIWACRGTRCASGSMRRLSTVRAHRLERREPHRLSGRQKQRFVMAGALAMHPAYLVLDEPASMLDPVGRADVLAIIERLRLDGTESFRRKPMISLTLARGPGGGWPEPRRDRT